MASVWTAATRDGCWNCGEVTGGRAVVSYICWRPKRPEVVVTMACGRWLAKAKVRTDDVICAKSWAGYAQTLPTPVCWNC